MTSSPQPVTSFFHSQVLAKLREHGVLLLENPDGRLFEAAGALSGTVGKVVVVKDISWQAKQEAELVFAALSGSGPFALSKTLLVVVSQRPRPALDPYLEYAEAGATWKLDLPELTAQALSGRLSLDEVKETFQVNPNLTLAEADDLGQAKAVQTQVFQPIYGVTDADAILEHFAYDLSGDAKLPLTQLSGVAQARLGDALDASSPAAARRSLWTLLFREVLRERPANGSAPPETVRAQNMLRKLRSGRPDAFADWAQQVQDAFKPYRLPAGEDVWLPGQDDLRQSNVAAALQANQVSASLATVQEDDFWAQRGERRVAWLSLRMAQSVLEEVLNLRQHLQGTLSHLVTQYQERWYRIDGAVRRLDTLTDVPLLVQPAVEHARKQARLAVQELAEATLSRYRAEGIKLPLPPHSHTFKDAVVPHLRDRSVAYLLIDALRFDLGKDLQQLLSAPALGFQVHLEARSGTLPSITPFGMAALMPGAEHGLEVTAQGDPVVAGKVVKDVNARKKLINEAYPLAQPQDYQLDKLPTEANLRKKLQDGTRLIVVRDSQLDSFGEVDAAPAVATFGMVLDQIVKATSTLLTAGVERVVIATDHGFLLVPGDDANKVIPPTTPQALLKRRLWMGELPLHGLPTDTLPVPLTEAGLGNPPGQSWHLLFPPGRALFITPGGNSNYTHGGPTLQERVLPLLTVTRHPEASTPPAPAKRKKEPLPALSAQFLPVGLAGFRGVRLQRDDLLGGPMKVRAYLVDNPENAKATQGTLMSPPNVNSEVTLEDQAAELLFTVPHSGNWTLMVQDGQGNTLLRLTEVAPEPVKVQPTHAWKTPAGAAEPVAELLPLLSALVTQRDLGADDIDKLVTQQGLSRRSRRAFDEYLDTLNATHPNLIVRDSTMTPHRYRLEGQL